MMFWRKYIHSFMVNDEVFQLSKANTINIDSLPPWLKDHYLFIREWINDKDYIKVKTSGSTGNPKTIKIHKNAFVFSALNTGKYLKLNPKDKALLCLPGSYIAGKMMIVRTFVLGLNLFWQRPSSTPELNRKIDFAAMTPMQLQGILTTNKSTINNIDKLIIGGAPVNSYILDNISILKTKIYETYGMTETVSHIAIKSINGNKKSEYFSVLPDIKIGIDKRKCLTITSDKLHVNKLASNDLVEIISNNKFKWLGRFDNVINSGGIKLVPEQIEAKLKKSIKNDFYIFGIQDPLLTNVPALVIEGKPEKFNLDFTKVLDKFEIPKKIYFLKKFIRTDSGKIKRKETLKFIT